MLEPLNSHRRVVLESLANTQANVGRWPLGGAWRRPCRDPCRPCHVQTYLSSLLLFVSEAEAGPSRGQATGSEGTEGWSRWQLRALPPLAGPSAPSTATYARSLRSFDPEPSCHEPTRFLAAQSAASSLPPTSSGCRGRQHFWLNVERTTTQPEVLSPFIRHMHGSKYATCLSSNQTEASHGPQSTDRIN